MTPELRERINGRRVIASVSGGKDSAALSLWLKEQEIEHERVFLDTGWEHDSTIAYLNGSLTDSIGPIQVTRGKLGKAAQARVDALMLSGKLRPRVRAAVLAGSLMVALILSRGMFPSKRRRFCTQELKVFAMQTLITSLVDAGADCINAVGIRRAESDARSAMTEWEWSDGFDCEVWRPLVSWSFDDVVAIHRRHGLSPNPLYLKGASRVGCWPCIYARKSEIRFISEEDPERIALIRELEQDVADLACERYAAKGETFESMGYSAPAFFQATIGGAGDTWPIDRVVEWSHTLRGGPRRGSPSRHVCWHGRLYALGPVRNERRRRGGSVIARILVCGSRRWSDDMSIRRALSAFEPGDVVIHGGAPGADTLASEAAIALGLKVEIYPANWERYGKSAGPIRNQLMIDSKPHCVIAFPLPDSRGTWDTIRRARAADIPVFVAGTHGDELLNFPRRRTPCQ